MSAALGNISASVVKRVFTCKAMSPAIADNHSKAGWSWGYVSAVDSRGRTIFIADAQRDGQRFIVRADEKLTAFIELESAIRGPHASISPSPLS
jgi:hypothetical protein